MKMTAVATRFGLLIGLINMVWLYVAYFLGMHTRGILVVHPEWPDVMAGQARDYFTEQGLSAEEVDAKVAEARRTFTLGNYAVMSALAALVLGTVLSALMMIHFRRATVIASSAANPHQRATLHGPSRHLQCISGRHLPDWPQAARTAGPPRWSRGASSNNRTWVANGVGP